MGKPPGVEAIVCDIKDLVGVSCVDMGDHHPPVLLQHWGLTLPLLYFVADVDALSCCKPCGNGGAGWGDKWRGTSWGERLLLRLNPPYNLSLFGDHLLKLLKDLFVPQTQRLELDDELVKVIAHESASLCSSGN